MERQRSEVMQRLEARRRRQADRDFEAEAVVQMLKNAESQSLAVQDRLATERGNQKSLVSCWRLRLRLCCCWRNEICGHANLFHIHEKQISCAAYVELKEQVW